METSIAGPKRPTPSLRPMLAVGFAIFSDSFLYGVVVPLTPFSPAKITSESDMAMLYCGYAVGVLLFTPMCGMLADKIGRKKPLLAGAMVQLLATLLIAMAPNFWVMMLARILQGGAASATWTAGLAVVAESYPDDRVQKMGLSMVGMTVGGLLGPLAGGLLYDHFGYVAPFALAGGVVLVDLTLRMTLLPWDQGHQQVANPLMRLLRDRSVIVSAVVVMLIAGGWGVIEPYLPIHLAKQFGTSSSAVGMLFTAAGVAYALVTNPVQRMVEWRGLRDTITVGLVLMAIGLPLMILAPNVYLATLLVCLVSVGYAYALNPTLAELAEAADRCAPGAYASVYAVFNITYALGMIGASTFTDPFVIHYSLLAGFMAVSAVLLAAVPLLWWSYKSRPVTAVPVPA